MQHAGGGTYDPACLNYTMGELNTRTRTDPLPCATPLNLLSLMNSRCLRQ